jgi:hypothetical protein
MAGKDKWDSDQHVDDFNKAARGEQEKQTDRDDKGSDQVKNSKLGKQDGPPPPKGPGMSELQRQKHKNEMAKDHQRATEKNGPQQNNDTPTKKTPQKGDLKKEFDRHR